MQEKRMDISVKEISILFYVQYALCAVFRFYIFLPLRSNFSPLRIMTTRPFSTVL